VSEELPTVSHSSTLLGPLDGLTADQINRRFQKIVAAVEWGHLPVLEDGAFAAIVKELQSRPRLFTFVDLFCGAGGSSTGLTMAGGLLLFAANHSRRNIATHSANYPGAEHACADLNHYDMRNIPAGADVLWASPICTELSPAGGTGGSTKKRNRVRPEQGELLKFGPVAEEEFIRTRATFHDVIRATEVHNFKYVLVENVVEAAWKWRLFGWWLDGMVFLGYGYQIISVSAAHVGDALNPHAPQRRDRMYVVFHRLDCPKPELEPRPVSWCDTCGQVEGVQVFKKPGGTLCASGRYFKVGKYGVRNGQYVYRCPNGACKHAIVTPLERPAAAVIDWTDLGTPIGERPADDPLSPNTIRRIERGMRLFAQPRQQGTDPAELAYPPFLDANGGNWNTEPVGVDRAFRARTASEWEGLVCPPFLANSNHTDDRAYPVADRGFPAATVKIGNGLVVPPGAFIATARNNVVPTSAWEPFTGINAGGNHHGLVVPYNRTGVATTTGQPMPTQTTKDRCGLAVPAGPDVDVMQARYRMIQWHEQARAQRFPASYQWTGNAGERTAGAGNAVASNVACWIGQGIAAALNRTAAHT
jgi:DNA (cytosine-5)-methyltransferase 1